MIFSLQRTNPRISTNIKLVMNSDGKLYLETINSNSLLERSVYKAYEYNENLEYGTNIKNFANQFPSKEVLYDVIDETSYSITDKTELQYHQAYDYGVYSDASRLILNNYRFFAPIHIDKENIDKIPDSFVVIRTNAVDKNSQSKFSKISDYIDEGEIVKVFDLTKIKRIFRNLEDSSIDMQYDSGTITTGLSLSTGLMVSKQESIINSMLSNETTITEFENSITNNYREHNLVYSNIVNLEFGFDDESLDKFVRYVGFYVNHNEVSTSTANNYDEVGVLRLNKVETGYKKYENDVELKTYDVVRQSMFVNGFGLEKAPQIRIKVLLRPSPNDRINILIGDELEHTVLFDSTNIQPNINETAKWIANELTTNYSGIFSTLVAFVENDNEVVIRSANISEAAKLLRVESSSSISVVQPEYNRDTYLNFFLGSGANTVSLNTFIDPTVYDKIQYVDDNGVRRSSLINTVIKYAGDFLYILSDDLVDKSSSPDNIWFLETLTDQPIICSVVQHRDLDTDTSISQYSDILDFDIELYKSYLIDTINDPDFRGGADTFFEESHPGVPASDAEVTTYKNNIISNITNYFDNIDLNRSYLFSDIDVSTEEASTTDNEYERLSENRLPTLLEVNKLYEFINKWKYKNGKDVASNDYRMNIALPFRFDSFTPSIDTVDRDIRYHTHSWLLIGEGSNPYLEVNEENIHKCLSYSRQPITEDLLLSEDIDAYEYLTYETDVNKHYSYSILRWDEDRQACFTYFRGVLLRFDDESLDGYKFSAILFSQQPVAEDIVNTKWLRNDKFESLTLQVRFYIPDPILTSLERGDSFYYLDRSLLYFSEDIYSTVQSSIDFGIDKISLTLYNNTTPKEYLGNVVTNNWFYEDQNDDVTLLHVAVGDLNRFNTSFEELLTIGQDFTIKFTETDDPNDPNYGMTITFVDIREVKPEHFWCTNILVHHVETRDPDGTDDLEPSDNIVESELTYDVYELFKNDPDTFDTNNIAYISRAIAYENAIYNRIVTANSNIARYRELSSSNIFTKIENTDVELIDSNRNSGYLKGTVIRPTEANIVVLLKSEKDVLQKLRNPYIFPIIRSSGEYEPQTKILSEFRSDDEFERIYSRSPISSNRNKLAVSRLSVESDRTILYPETYIRDIKYEEFYEYFIKSTSNDALATKYLPWISNPIEYRSYVSIVLNSTERFKSTINYDPAKNLSKYLYDELYQYCPISDFILTEEIKKRILDLKYDTTNLTVKNYDIEFEIVSNFIRNTFLKVYELESVQLADDTYVNFTVNDSILNIIDDISVGVELILNFKR